VSLADKPDTLDLRSYDIAEEKRQELLRLFPEIRTEGGKLDFERLKLELGEVVDVGKERYGLNWPGKADCFKTIQTPSLGTLLPCREENINFDTTENLIIEGDNLEVLKLLQKSYLGKVKMIYIDPPYNTGNDFIYPDNYIESLQTYLEYTGQVDSEGRKFGTNTDTDGRFHSKWLNMMYTRLYLARNLLREDGAIFVTIDDTEVANLRRLMDEIWGEENFVATVAWQKVFAKKNKALISGSHDHILIYVRSLENWSRNLLPRDELQAAAFRNPDNDPRGKWQSVSFSVQSEDSERRQAYRYDITLPSGRKVAPPTGRHWNGLPDRYEELLADRRIWFGSGGDSPPRVKLFLSEVQQGIVPDTWWRHEDTGNNQEAKKEILELFSNVEPYSTPKPTRLVKRMLEIATNESDLVLDFFAGSGTTAHAVLNLNKLDGGNRKFILVQLPEPTERTDYPTIADICKERVRRVINKLNEDNEGKLTLNGTAKQDRGFRVFKLAESNLKPWNAEVQHDATALARQLDLHVDHIREGRTPDDLLYEILLKSGFPLTTPVETLTQAGKTVYSVAGGALFICLERELTLELIRAMAARKPERVVCLDEGFAGNDQLKVNAMQIFKTQGITSFKTV